MKETLKINVARDKRKLQQRLELRCTDKASSRMPVVKRLDPYTVTSPKKQLLALIVNHKGKHFIEFIQKRRPVLLIQMQQYLCVGILRAKTMSLLLQSRTKFGGIKNFAVEDNPYLSARIAHRLVTFCKVENAQPTHGQQH